MNPRPPPCENAKLYKNTYMHAIQSVKGLSKRISLVAIRFLEICI